MIGFKVIDNSMIVIDIEGIETIEYKDIFQNKFFYEIYISFINHCIKEDNIFSDMFCTNGKKDKNKVKKILSLIVKYSKFPPNPELDEKLPHTFEGQSNDDFVILTKIDFHNLVNAFMKYWYDHPRYLIIHNDKFKKNMYLFSRDDNSEDLVSLNENLRKKILTSYRNICFNLDGLNPSIYRQSASGCNVELYVKQNGPEVMNLPKEYEHLYKVSLVGTAFLRPPLILFTKSNKRKGRFLKVDKNPLEDPNIMDHNKFLCFPLRVGDLNILFYFHEKFFSVAAGVINLFELGSSYLFREEGVDGIYVMGTENTDIVQDEVVFYEDNKNDMVVAVCELKDEKDYFGYVKKSLLTIHNAKKIKEGKIPIHGAMSRITLKDGSEFNIIIVGDSGAGKSESLEAFRILSKDYLKNIDIIFDDMGSIYKHNGQIYAQGTEIGAFVRLDDLDPGYAFGRMETAIFMNPHIQNARVVVPVAPYKQIVEHTKVDMFLYANNYELVDEDHAELELLDNIFEAFTTFRNGYRLSKGTTSEVGLVQSYFANPFGAPSYKKEHDEVMMDYLKTMYDTKVPVGMLRTQLGIDKFSHSGPQQAAKALFNYLMKKKKNK